MSKTGGFLLLAALLVVPLAARIGSSFYLTYKYEKFLRHRLGTDEPLARLGISRHDVEGALEPLSAQRYHANLPTIFGEEEDIEHGYAFRYYFLHPALAGCFLYFVFDRPDETGHLVGYRDACE